MASFADRRKFRGSSYRYPKTKSLGTNKEAIETKKKNANNLNENKSGGNNKERHFSHPTVMGYPVARGAKEHTGDTLLINGTGRTDFQNGNSKDAYNSIFNKLLKLPE